MTQTERQDKMIQSVAGIVKRCMQQLPSPREMIRAGYICLVPFWMKTGLNQVPILTWLFYWKIQDMQQIL
jgi:hypothetical protein